MRSLYIILCLLFTIISCNTSTEKKTEKVNPNRIKFSLSDSTTNSWTVYRKRYPEIFHEYILKFDSVFMSMSRPVESSNYIVSDEIRKIYIGDKTICQILYEQGQRPLPPACFDEICNFSVPVRDCVSASDCERAFQEASAILNERVRNCTTNFIGGDTSTIKTIITSRYSFSDIEAIDYSNQSDVDFARAYVDIANMKSKLDILGAVSVPTRDFISWCNLVKETMDPPYPPICQLVLCPGLITNGFSCPPPNCNQAELECTIERLENLNNCDWGDGICM